MIIIRLDVILAKNKVRSKELAEAIGITEQNLSLLKNGKVKGIRLDTLEKICAFWTASRATSRNTSRTTDPRSTLSQPETMNRHLNLSGVALALALISGCGPPSATST